MSDDGLYELSQYRVVLNGGTITTEVSASSEAEAREIAEQGIVGNEFTAEMVSGFEVYVIVDEVTDVEEVA